LKWAGPELLLPDYRPRSAGDVLEGAMATPPDDDFVRSFESGHRRYENFATRLEQLIVDLLSQAELSVIQVESRAKTVSSFREKVARKNYRDPFRQMTDLVGLRIVCYYLEDVEEIGNIIAREFHVHEDLSVKKAAELATDRFGYRSDHYIVSLSEARRNLGEWTEFAELRAEIQVRTALQHAWAAVDHKISYKKVREIPKELQRRLIRLSALFELADEEFSAIRIQQVRLLADQTESVGQVSFRYGSTTYPSPRTSRV
jgi:putative GTP pyrophosphokinase